MRPGPVGVGVRGLAALAIIVAVVAVLPTGGDPARGTGAGIAHAAGSRQIFIPLALRNTAVPTPAASAASCPGATFVLPTTGTLGWTYRYPCRNQGGFCPDSGVHHGIDIGSPAGAPIRAAYGGKVFLRSSTWVSLDHPDLKLTTFYTHLATIAVRVGDSVSQGQVLGTLQDMGAGEFNHLHFSVLKELGNDLLVEDTRDPSPYLAARVSVATGAVPHQKNVLAWCSSA